MNAEVVKLSDICELRRELVDPNDARSARYVALEHLDSGRTRIRRWDDGSRIRSTKSVFASGDVLYGKLRPYLRKAATAEWGGICSTEFLVLRPRPNFDSSFVAALLQSKRFVAHAVSHTVGVNHPRVSWGSLSEFECAVPCDADQRRISEVLSGIQDAIELQTRTLQILKELKVSTIAVVFRRGLRRQSLKETEVGEIPTSWRVEPLGSVCSLFSGGTPPKNTPQLWSGNVPWLSPKDMKTIFLSDTTDHISEHAATAFSRVAPARTVFVVVRGMILAKEFPVAISSIPMAFNQDMKAIVPSDELNPSYLLYALISQKHAIRAEIGSSAHGTRRLGSSSLERLLIPVADRGEQAAIADVLETIDRAIEVGTARERLLTELFDATLDGLMSGRLAIEKLAAI